MATNEQIILTNRAAAKIREIIAENRLPVRMVLRVDCEDREPYFVHSLDFADEPQAGDLLCRSQGLRICMPASAATLLRGTIIDFQDAGGLRGFRFDNPNERAGSRASDPACISLSQEKLAALCPKVFGWKARLGRLFNRGRDHEVSLRRLSTHLQDGDSRAAVVVSTGPLLVAAYSDDLDCVALLRFPDDFADRYTLACGSRLLTVNRGFANLASDLVPGPGSNGTCGDFMALIAEFLSDDLERIKVRKREIAEAEWRRAMELGQKALTDGRSGVRSGRPL